MSSKSIEGSGALVLTATAPGYQARRVLIQRSYADLEVQLSPDDRSASMRIDLSDRGRVPKIEWYLDGRPIDEVEGVQVERVAKRETLTGLSSGIYDVLVRAGEDVLRHDREFRVRGAAELEL